LHLLSTCYTNTSMSCNDILIVVTKFIAKSFFSSDRNHCNVLLQCNDAEWPCNNNCRCNNYLL